MDIYVFIILFIIVFSIFRSYLRGTFMGLLDLLSYFISIGIALVSSNKLGHLFYTTNFYADVQKSITGIVNFNAILSAESITEKTAFIYELSAPNVINNYILANNNPMTFELLGVSTFEEYVTSVFMYLIMRTIAFFLVFFLVFFIIYLIKLSIIPYMNFTKFGITDSLISIIIGFIKGVTIIYLALLFVPALFAQFNYISLYTAINDSQILTILYNNNPLLNSFLSSQLY